MRPKLLGLFALVVLTTVGLAFVWEFTIEPLAADHEHEFGDTRAFVAKVGVFVTLASIAPFLLLHSAARGRDEARRALIASRERYRQLFESMQSGHALHRLVVNDEGRATDYVFLGLNPAYSRLTGLGQWAVGRCATEVVPDLEPAWLERFSRVVKHGEPARFEYVSASRGRRFEVVAYRSSPGQFATLYEDVTDRRAQEAKLLEAQKMEALGTLASGLAHDFNNVLQGIVGVAELAKDNEDATPAIQESFDDIVTASHRAADIIRPLLFVAGDHGAERKALPVQEVVAEALKLVRGAAPNTIEIVEDIDRRCPPVFANATQLHQVVVNLCTNACEAMKDRGGRLEVKLSVVTRATLDTVGHPPEWVELLVSDTGHGMDEATRLRIFEPFFSTRGPHEGTGLGLAAVHGIVTKHGGHIDVHSAPGEGATFKILLPPCEPEAVLAPQPVLTPVPVSQRIRVLFVDDEPLVAKTSARMLRRLGFEVQVHTSARQALDAFRAAPADFDVVITDQRMPLITGTEFAGELLGIRPDVPIILHSGQLPPSEQQALHSKGIRAFLPKPHDRETLVSCVHSVLENGVA